MNIHIIKGLLLDCTSLVKRLLPQKHFLSRSAWNQSGSTTFPDMVRLFTYRNSRKAPPLSFGCSFSRKTNGRYCGLRQHLSSVFAFPSPETIEDMEALFAKVEFLYTCEQYPPCGGSVRCVAQNSLYPTSLAVGSRQEGGSCCPKTAQDMLPLQASRHHPFCGEEQHYIGTTSAYEIAISRLKE